MKRDSLEDFLAHIVANPAEYHRLQAILNNPNNPALNWHLRFLIHFPVYISYTERLKTLKYRYTLEVDAFVDCLARYPTLMGNTDGLQRLLKSLLYGYSCTESESLKVVLSAFLHDLWQRLLSPEFKREANKQNSAMNRRGRDMCKYVDELFAAHARLLVINVVLSYTVEANVELEDLEDHLQKLYDSTRVLVKPTIDAEGKERLGLFSHLKGHIWKIEYGGKRQLHVHTLWFFDGSKRDANADILIGKSIGEQWLNITGCYGNYWNSQTQKHAYEAKGRCGIGEIRYNDAARIDNLKTVVDYFCKRKQYIKPIDKPKMQLVRSGNDPAKSNLGAPRKWSDCEGQDILRDFI
jgi:hypothetical protein